MKKLLLIILTILASNCSADEFSETITTIGPWSIKYYKNLELAGLVGTRCSAIQYSNGAQLAITADPDNPTNIKTIRLLVSFDSGYSDAIIYINDGMTFSHPLNTYEPQKNASSSIFKISEFIPGQLFVTFSLGTIPVGRYQFSLDMLHSASDYVHQAQCLLPNQQLYITKNQYHSVLIGESLNNAIKKFGGYPDEMEAMHDYENKLISNTAIWKNGFNGNSVILEITSNQKITRKYLRKK